MPALFPLNSSRFYCIVISDELSKHHQALLGSHWLPTKLNARACVSRGLEAAMGDLVPGFGAARNWKFKGLLSNPALVSPPVANSPPPSLSNDSGPAHGDELGSTSRYKLLERKPTKNGKAQHIIGCVRVCIGCYPQKRESQAN